MEQMFYATFWVPGEGQESIIFGTEQDLHARFDDYKRRGVQLLDVEEEELKFPYAICCDKAVPGNGHLEGETVFTYK
jgi:hypothetical protein